MTRPGRAHALAPPPGYENLPPAVPAARIGPQTEKGRFNLEPWSEIAFAGGEEWLVKRVLPRTGIAAIYGRPGSFKSFVVAHIALCVALGREWAGRRVSEAPVVYIAAEGAGGLRKRKAAYAQAWPDLPTDVPLYLVSAAPNLGAGPGDLSALIADIETARVSPGLIVLDTLAQTLGGADENGAGMTSVIKNAGELAARFDALVLVVHHVGLGEGTQQRMRGHSSLHGALDAQILCERQEGEFSATLTLQKLKDELSDVRLIARLSRVVVGLDEDGDEISTLIVDEVAPTDATPAKPQGVRIIPASRRLLRDTLAQAINEAGEEVRPFGSASPEVRAVAEEHLRKLYYAAVAEQAEADEDADKLANRQRTAFRRAVKGSLDAKEAMAREVGGRRMLWLP